MLMTPAAPAFAHDIFAKCVQHTAHLTADARYLDLELELMFFEEESAEERHTMDTDGDRLISTAEKESYLARLVPTLSRSVTLRAGGQEVALTSLYEPELDLLANNGTGSGHHCLRLFLFASTPAHLSSGDQIVIEDRLWPEADSFGTMRSEGRDGFKLESESSLDRAMSEDRSKTKTFKIKCLFAPGKKTVSPEGRGTEASPDPPTSRACFADPVELKSK